MEPEQVKIAIFQKRRPFMIFIPNPLKVAVSLKGKLFFVFMLILEKAPRHKAMPCCTIDKD